MWVSGGGFPAVSVYLCACDDCNREKACVCVCVSAFRRAIRAPSQDVADVTLHQ